MAATRLIALHLNKGKSVAACLKARTDYATNPEKTEKGDLVTSYECDSMTVDEEFMLTKRKYLQITGRRRDNDVIAYQIRQSFKPGEITAEDANRVGYELALRFTKGKYAFIVATHTDRAHIHNHIIFNSTALDGTRKFNNFRRSGLALQRLSDIVCLEHGLSVIEKKPYSERQKQENFPKRKGTRQRKGMASEHIGLLIDVQEKLKTKGPGYARWAKVHNLKEMSKSILFLREHGIESLEQLNDFIEEKTVLRDEFMASVRTAEGRMSEISVLRKHIFDYSNTRKTYEAYRKAGYSRKFFEAHREEITVHKAAKKAFDELGVKKIPKVKELNEEYAELLAKKKQAFADYRKCRDKVKECLIVKENISSLYEAEKKEADTDNRKRKRQER